MTNTTSQLSNALSERYTIEREIGAGGMATVYLAHDIKHDRNVAIKVLRPELAAVLGAERFVQEIKTTANLQHPHILPLFDSGQADGFLYYVMPYIEGETLRDKLDRETQLGIDEAIKITTEVADALDYAHRHNVIHRDIKPENILLHDGRPMVADFGIALAVSAAAGGRMTETGLSLGTPHYMSPEQATAEKDLSNRSDIYSLGAVLYETLTGDPPHTGSSAQQVIMKIVTEEPQPVTTTRKAVPPNVAAAVAKALEKLPADRFESAASFAEALSNPAFAFASHAPPAKRVASWTPRTALAGALAVLSALLLLVALWGWLRPRPVTPSQTARFSIVLPPDQAWAGVSGVDVAFAPDGSHFVYRGAGGGGQLYRRNIGELDARPLAGTVGASQPFFSPDGEWLAFVESGLLQRIPSAGGPPLPISDVGSLLGASWGSDGNIVMGDRAGGLRSVAATGGPLTHLTVVDTAAGESSHRWPEILPRGNGVLYSVYYAELSEARIAVLSLESGDVKVLDHSGTGPHFVEGGYLVYGRADGTVVGVPFDEQLLEVRGSAVPVIEGVGIASGGALELAIARNGSIVYAAGLGVGSLSLSDDRGNTSPLPLEPAGYLTPRFSPAGDRVAVAVAGHIWVYDRNLKTLSVRTTEGQNYHPSWSPDGNRIFLSRVSGTGAGLYSVPADGSANPTRLYGESATMWESELSPDGQWLAFSDNPVNPVIEIVAWESAGGTERRRLTQTGSQIGFDISPDGRWIAYGSNQTGQSEVYVTSFPYPSGHVQISVDGGEMPAWSPDGRVLYYVDEDLLIAANVNTSASQVTVQDRNPLFSYNFRRLFGMRHFDVDPKGNGFVVVDAGGDSGAIVVALDWVSELRERLGR